MKRRILSLALTLALCLGLAMPALAAEVPSEHEIPDGAYTLTRQGTGAFVERQIRTGFGVKQLEEAYATAHTGYHTLSPDTAWTVKNTSADTIPLIAIAVEYYVPLGDHDYGAGAGYGVLIDRNGLGGNTASGEDWVNLDMLAPGDSVTFTLADVLANEKEGIADLNTGVERGADETDGIVLVLSIYQQYTDSIDYLTDSYCYMIGGDKPASGFFDVPDDLYCAKAVAWAVEKGVTAGTSATTFSPAKTCSTAEILTFLWRAAGKPAPKGDAAFSDVPSGVYYTQAALWAKEQGLVAGDTLVGDAPCTRADVVRYLWTLAGRPEADAADFSDVPADSPDAAAVAWAVKAGITSGTGDGGFSPTRTCTRGEIATFLFRYFATK